MTPAERQHGVRRQLASHLPSPCCAQPAIYPAPQLRNSMQFRGRQGQRCAQGLRAAIEQFPGPRPKGSPASPADSGDSMDLVVGEIVETVRNMRNEASLLRYLRALKALQGAFLLPRTRRITRIRLQVGRCALVGCCSCASQLRRCSRGHPECDGHDAGRRLVISGVVPDPSFRPTCHPSMHAFSLHPVIGTVHQCPRAAQPRMSQSSAGVSCQGRQHCCRALAVTVKSYGCYTLLDMGVDMLGSLITVSVGCAA